MTWSQRKHYYVIFRCKHVEISERDSVEVDSYWDLALANSINDLLLQKWLPILVQVAQNAYNNPFLLCCACLGRIPALYREVFEVCSCNGEPVTKEVFECFLSHCVLEKSALKAIWELTGASQGVSRTNFYKALALIAWTQQGKTPCEKLFDNFTGEGGLHFVCNCFINVFLCFK